VTSIPNVLQEGPRQVHIWLLKPENQIGYGEHCGPCPCPNVKVQAQEGGTVTCSGKCVDKNGNPLGLLTIEDIRELLATRIVARFNYSEDPEVILDEGCDMFYVRRPGYVDYTFSENGAPEAVFVDDTLTMPDAQGFPCVFYFKAI